MHKLKLILSALVLSLGCSMNSETKNDACSNHKKACGCPGTEMSCCRRNADGTTPCSKDECNCDMSAMATMVAKPVTHDSCCK